MSDLIGTGNITGEPAARWAWVRWAHSARDGQVHAFPIEDSQRGRWLQAVCSHTAPPAALGSSLPTPYCLTCLRSSACTSPESPDITLPISARCERDDRAIGAAGSASSTPTGLVPPRPTLPGHTAGPGGASDLPAADRPATTGPTRPTEEL